MKLLVILTAGEDGKVMRYDDREGTAAETFVKYKCRNHSIFQTQLHTIDFSPNGFHFAIGGHYHSATLFDYRSPG